MHILEEKKLKNATVEMVIEVPQSRVEVEYKSVIDRIAKNAKIDGFRRGKAPLSLVESKFEKEATSEVIENLLKTTYIEVLQEKEYKPIGIPSFQLESFNKNHSLKYRVRFEVMPTVELGNYRGVAVKERTCKVSEEDVEREINDLREKYARISKKEQGAKVEKGDLLRLGVKRIDNVNSEEAEAMPYKEYTIIVGKSESEHALDKYVIGLSVGQTKEITIKYPKDYEFKDLAGQKITYKVKIEEISKMDLPNADDEFAKDVSNFSTIAELKENIRSYFEKVSSNAARAEVMEAIKNAILEKSSFDIPESLVKAEESSLLRRFAKRFNLEVANVEEFCAKMGFPLEDFKKRLYEEALKDVKWEIARLEIARKEGIAVTDEDYKNELEIMAQQSNMSVSELEKHIEKNDARERIEHEVLLSKVDNFLYNNAKIDKQKAVSYFDFMKNDKK
ncbi:MAG: trigger factor [Spirochaetes bacterium]|nr:trigger factor [Spirochaetota bacterium]